MTDTAAVISLHATNLKDLALKINVCAGKADDYRVTAACHLAEAKKLCRSQSISFKSWVKDNIKLSYTEAVRLTKAGESDNPAKAIADIRAQTRETVQRARSKAALRSATPDEEDDNEIVPAGELTTSMRIRGLIYRAKEAKELAETDDMQGVDASDEVRAAVVAAVEAWIKLLSNLEGDDNG